MKIKVETGKKENRNTFDTGKVKVQFGESVKHNGEIDLRQDVKHVNQETIPAKSPKVKKPNNIVDTSSSMIAKKGQKVSITKNIMSDKIIIALEWGYKKECFDLDVSVFMMDTNNKTAEADFIFYNNTISRNNAIKLHSDFGKSLIDSYDEVVEISLNSIPANIKLLALTITVDEELKNKYSFADLKDAKLKVIDASNNKEIISYEFTENMARENAIVASEIYKHKDEWKINCIGSGFNGGLQALCDNYGISTK